MIADKKAIEINGETKDFNTQTFNLHELIEMLKAQEENGEEEVYIGYSTDYDDDFRSLDFMFSRYRMETDEEYNLRMEKDRKTIEDNKNRINRKKSKREADEMETYLRLKQKFENK